MSRVPDATIQNGLWVREGLNFFFMPHIILDEFVVSGYHLELLEYNEPIRANGRNWIVILYELHGDEVVRRRFASLEHAAACYWYSQNNMAAKLITGTLEGQRLHDLVGEDGVEYVRTS